MGANQSGQDHSLSSKQLPLIRRLVAMQGGFFIPTYCRGAISAINGGVHHMTKSKTEKQSVFINGGKRPGAGRKAGVPNKRTAALQAAVESTGVTPLEYMLQVMRDETNDPRERLNAAVSAAPFVHAKLSSVEINAKVTTHEASLDDLA